MFCKHLGSLESSRVNLQLEACLKEAGDVVSYFVEGENNRTLHISYRRDLVFYHGDNPKPFLLKPAIKETCIRTFKIKNLQTDPAQLIQIIQPKLKTVGGFDFDQTLTGKHTFNHPDRSIEEMIANLQYPDDTKKLLKEFSEKPNCVAIIVSNNFRETIQRYIKLWFEFSPFQEIYGREQFHDKNEGNKEVCFYYFYKKLVPKDLVDADGFIEESEIHQCTTLDVVRACLFDDEPFLIFSAAGIEVINHVPKTRSYLIELQYLFQLKSVQYTLDQKNHDEENVRIFKHIQRQYSDSAVIVKQATELAVRQCPTLKGPLHLAVRARLINIVTVLLREGHDPDEKDLNGLDCLHHACLNLDIPMIRLLMQNRKKQAYDSSYIIIAVNKYSPEVVECLLGYKCFNLNDYDKDGYAAVHLACLKGHNPILRMLLAAEASMDLQTRDERYTPLHICALHKKRALSVTLLNARANIFLKDSAGMYPGQLAIFSNSVICEELIAATGNRLNDFLDNGRTLLTHCVHNYSVIRNLPEIIGKVLELDPKLADKLGDTPMRIASDLQYELVIVALTMRGVSESSLSQSVEDDEEEVKKSPVLL